jgi:hypothetical protein
VFPSCSSAISTVSNCLADAISRPPALFPEWY